VPEDRPERGPQRFNPEADTPAWRRKVKDSELGRVAAALYRRRKAAEQVLLAPGGIRAQPREPWVRRRVRMVCWMPAGPGSRDALLDTWASAAASAAPGEVALLVTDDWTTDCHEAEIQKVVPGAVVVRTRVPSGGPPRLWPVTALAVAAALHHFDFDYLVKLDTDALVVGPGWVERIAAAIDAAGGPAINVADSPVPPGSVPPPAAAAVAGAADRPPVVAAPLIADGAAQAPADHSIDTPSDAAARNKRGGDRRRPPVGIAGAFRKRPDGEEETDEPYHRRILAGELPHDHRLAGWHARAIEHGWPEGSIVQGGCLVITRAFADALVAEDALTYRPRIRAIVSEDLLLTLMAYAFGLRALSLGGPAGPLAIANKHLPLPLDELLDPASRWVVAHSTKIGLDGEPEDELRARAEAARALWP
jgi:hypothetical protein